MSLAETITAATEHTASHASPKKEPVLSPPTQAAQSGKTYQDGVTAGAQAAHARLSAVLGAEGVQDSPASKLAAVALALKSPEMTAEDVASFVSSHLGAMSGASPGLSPRSLDRRHHASGGDPLAGMAGPNAKQAKADGWAKAMQNTGAKRVSKS